MRDTAFPLNPESLAEFDIGHRVIWRQARYGTIEALLLSFNPKTVTLQLSAANAKLFRLPRLVEVAADEVFHSSREQ